MPLDQIGILLVGAATIAALVLGALAASFFGAVRNALVIWVVLLLAWYLWGPPLPYYGLASNAVAAIGLGIALCVAASLAHWVSGLFKRRPASP
jgi:hypothetical protein